jgi:predicted Na+-dependent transporter
MNTTNNAVTSTADSHQNNDSIWGAIVSNVLLFVLVFGLSATVQFKALRREASNKRALGVGLGLQFLLLPLFGYLAILCMTATHAGFTESMAISLLVVVSSPGGSFANLFCSVFNAELALSVALTTLSSLLAVGFLPANLFLYTYLVSIVS